MTDFAKLGELVWVPANVNLFILKSEITDPKKKYPAKLIKNEKPLYALVVDMYEDFIGISMHDTIYYVHIKNLFQGEINVNQS